MPAPVTSVERNQSRGISVRLVSTAFESPYTLNHHTRSLIIWRPKGYISIVYVSVRRVNT